MPGAKTVRAGGKLTAEIMPGLCSVTVLLIELVWLRSRLLEQHQQGDCEHGNAMMFQQMCGWHQTTGSQQAAYAIGLAAAQRRKLATSADSSVDD
jgi:hypothetical protein